MSTLYSFGKSFKKTVHNDLNLQREIIITIEDIENMTGKGFIYFIVQVEHNGIVLGQSTKTKIEFNHNNSPKIISLDYKTSLIVSLKDKDSLRALISTPIIIKLIDASSRNSSLTESEKLYENKKCRKKVNNVVKNKTIGICSMDLWRICYEQTLKGKLIAYKPSQPLCLTLPVLNVTVKREDVQFFPQTMNPNFLTITLESMFNIPFYLTDNLQYNCQVYLPLTDKTETIIFTNGKRTNCDYEEKICWQSLQHLDNKAKLSNYKINSNYCGIKNNVDKTFNMQDVIDHYAPRIVWNSMTRIYLENEDNTYLASLIKKDKYCKCVIQAFQLLESGKIVPRMYQCDIDLSHLLYVGNNKTRVLSQVYLSSADSITENMESLSELSINLKKGFSFPDIERTPLKTENGSPVIILFNFELHRPFIDEKIMNALNKHIQKITVREKYCYSIDTTLENYSISINKILDVLSKSYRDFIQNKRSCEKKLLRDESEESKSCPFSYLSDELSSFTDYLHVTGRYISIHDHLRKNIITLLDQKFYIKESDLNSRNVQHLISEAYRYLVEQMNCVLNKRLECINIESRFKLDSKCHILSAEECYELGEIQYAEKQYMEVVDRYKLDPSSWLKYAIFLMKNNDLERALECCIEVISLDSRHKIGLFLYGSILLTKKCYGDGFIILKALVQMYPTFIEGWSILHVFYLITNYLEGAEICYQIVQDHIKCNKIDEDLGFLNEEPYIWSPIIYHRDNFYFNLIIILFKLHLFYIIDIILFVIFDESKISKPYVYYKSLLFYYKQFYEKALIDLEELDNFFHLDFDIYSLMGHCYYKSGEMETAIHFYELCNSTSENHHHVHIIRLRLGFYYIENQQFDKSETVFSKLCKFTPTNKTWLGMGISLYELKEFELAEAALTEANRIKCDDATTWAYLCLLNLSCTRYEEFSQCYRQFVKCDFQNHKLKQRIQFEAERLDYSTKELTQPIEL